MKFRTQYTERTPKTGITFSEPSRTKQDFVEECDINNIMRRYEVNGILPICNAQEPVFADVSEFGDYRESLHRVMAASDAFNSLPSELRKKFDYDPQKMIDFIKDPANKEECIKYGFINKVDNDFSGGSSSVDDGSGSSGNS